MTTSTTLAEDRVRELIAENKRLNDRNVEVSMLAHQWMVAHDNRAAGLPVTYPSPADVPASLFLLALMAAAAEPLEGLTASEWRDEYFRRHRDVQRIMIECNDQIQALTLERDAMREGLKPFAEACAESDEGTPGDHVNAWETGMAMGVNYGDFRRARSLLHPSRGEDQGLSQSQPSSHRDPCPMRPEGQGDLEEWQPIETAPLDGSYVDLWAFWPESEVWRRSPDARWGGDDWFMDRQYQRRQFVCPPVITHWMRHRDGPVPALPHSSTGEG